MHLSKAGYYADFVVYPLLILSLLGYQLVQIGAGALRLAMLVVLCVAGVGLWTLTEYVLHRYVLHRVPILHAMHEAHHSDPAALVGTPSWVSALLFMVAAFLPAWWAFGTLAASALTAGLMLGYLSYVSVHHVTHHWRLVPGSRLYGLKHRHARHHFAKTPGNFGVTTMFWDKVFGTGLEAGMR
jgi:sterol desaturase/sphingolipid hydroxylase (fatty acid hydroxylase superfamily)